MIFLSDMEVSETTEPSKEPRRSETLNQSESVVVSREHLLNFPLPDVASKSCLVKVFIFFALPLTYKHCIKINSLLVYKMY